MKGLITIMKARHIFWGIFFILAAVVVVASQVGSFVQIGVWSVIAAVLLLAWLISGISRISFVEITLPLSLLYLIFQKPLGFFYISPWLLIIAAIFLGIGLSLIIRKRRRPSWSHHHGNRGGNTTGGDGGPNGGPSADGGDGEGGWQSHGGYGPEATILVNDDDSYPSASVKFGAASRYLHSQNLIRGEFSANFGALEIYLDQARLAPQGAQFFVECNCGTMTIYVPRSWTVRDTVTATLGVVSNDKRFAQPAEDSPLLELTGHVALGNVEVSYV